MNASRRLRQAVYFVALSLPFAACSWFTDFKQQPKIDPWESPNDTTPSRGNPQNSVPVQGSAAPGFMYGRLGMPQVLDSMAGIANPIPADARSVANGRKYYQINCAVCHGQAGQGMGEITKHKAGALFPPSLLAPTMARTDGYVFAIIRNGRGMMPPYNRIEEPDRWDVVNYIRALQGQVAGITADTTPPGRPGETGEHLPGFTEMGPTRPAPYYRHMGSQAGVRNATAVVAPASAPVIAAPAVPTGAATPADSTKKGGAL
ncbi:MAG: hypothetical protein JWO05_3063 [Gemmatimonadetes bacterium]|nr:hypothetical protein [Gemmatimonadota bacterium]